MKYIDLDEQDINMYINESIMGNIDKKSDKTFDGFYHHNTLYKNINSIVDNGILCIRDLNELRQEKYSKEEMTRFANTESHVNGVNGISLSIIGLPDILPNEFEYNPYNKNFVDLILDKNLDTSRESINYGNEFVRYKSIKPKSFRSIDIRFLELINSKNDYYITEDFIYRYNVIRELSKKMLENNMNIELREMSKDSYIIDKEKMANSPILRLKK